MSFLSGFFKKEKGGQSVILIDIGADSVAGAYARYETGKPPALLYTTRVTIETKKDEPHERAMLHALQVLGTTLLHEGAPTLVRSVGNSAVDMVLVSIDAPWQETSVRTEHFEAKEPFLFTKELVLEKLRQTGSESSEKILADESVIGTTLNGYTTSDPYGHEAHRAAIIVLTSLIERRVAGSIITTLEGLFHTKNILPIAGTSLRYQAMRKIFPHEQNALIIDATGGSLISVVLVRKGLFVTMLETSTPPGNAAWIISVMNTLTEISKHYPLPRTLFLLAREPEILKLQPLFLKANFGALWLSENPPVIVPVLKKHLSDFVQQPTNSVPDIVLLFMALYYRDKDNFSGDVV